MHDIFALAIGQVQGDTERIYKLGEKEIKPTGGGGAFNCNRKLFLFFSLLMRFTFFHGVV